VTTNLPSLFCYRCGHGFYDSELLKVRLAAGTELLHHSECYDAWAEEQLHIEATFGVKFAEPVFFERQYFHRQTSASA
jgi:hypothetical protein